MKKKIRQNIAFLLAFFMVLSYCAKHAKTPHYELLEGEEAFASYSGGLIYIGDEEQYDTICLESGDVFVLDHREDRDPNMSICNSYQIRSSVQRREILEVLCCYEECFPSAWNRSLEAMELEWTLHNLSYDFYYQRESSTHVDLNNADEEQYDCKVLQKILN